MAARRKAVTNIQALPSSKERIEAVTQMAETLTQDEKKAVSRAICIPTQPVVDVIWKMIVLAFALVLVGAFVTMALSVGFKGKLEDGTLLTVFTTAAGFLGGLLIPSPAAEK